MGPREGEGARPSTRDGVENPGPAAASPGEPPQDWFSSTEVSLAELMSPEHVLRDTVQRRRSASGRSGSLTGSGGSGGTPTAAPLDARPPPLDKRVRAYRIYLVKHIGIMTCACAALPLSRVASLD